MNLLKSTAIALLALAAIPAAWAQQVQPTIETKVAMCVGCHGIPGYRATFPEVYQVPKIAGQNEKYLAAALTAYAKGERRHPTMRGIALTLSEADVAEIAAYYAGKGTGQSVPDTPPPAPEPARALLERGICASCHGANFNKPIDGTYPKLAGQPADYLYAAMKAYQIDNGQVVGRTHAIMGAQIRPFSHVELRTISRYLASLPGDMQTVRESGLRR